MKNCIIGKHEMADRDMALMGITIDNQEVYMCVECLAKHAAIPFGISINLSDENYMPIFLPTIKHIGIAKEFINPQNNGSV